MCIRDRERGPPNARGDELSPLGREPHEAERDVSLGEAFLLPAARESRQQDPGHRSGDPQEEDAEDGTGTPGGRTAAARGAARIDERLLRSRSPRETSAHPTGAGPRGPTPARRALRPGRRESRGGPARRGFLAARGEAPASPGWAPLARPPAGAPT